MTTAAKSYKKNIRSKKTHKLLEGKVSSSMAKTSDGSIQITYTISFEYINKKRKETAKKMGDNIEVPGFRKGKAPLEKLIEHIPDNTLLERTLSAILPSLVGDSIKEYKIKPVIYPKFELVKAKDGEDWIIRANTAELPDIKLGDYKKEISGSSRAKSLWTPGKDKSEKKKPSRAEKEQEVIKILLESVKINIPKVLLDEEVNARLSKLLNRLEKLGLDLESYLASTGTTAENLRKEYEKQAKDSIKMDLLLEKVAQEENIKISDDEINKAIEGYSQNEDVKKELVTDERKRIIESIMRKRKALENLTSLLAS
jgi:FKBP-type peptidyl-prolyl cis-trans isomerase (trigger factor)